MSEIPSFLRLPAIGQGDSSVPSALLPGPPGRLCRAWLIRSMPGLELSPCTSPEGPQGGLLPQAPLRPLPDSWTGGPLALTVLPQGGCWDPTGWGGGESPKLPVKSPSTSVPDPVTNVHSGFSKYLLNAYTYQAPTCCVTLDTCPAISESQFPYQESRGVGLSDI